MKLLWLDLETTGLDATKDRILEVAAFVADLERPFERESLIFQTVFSLTPEDAKRLDPFILDMHTRNGLLAECLAFTLRSLADAEAVLLSLIPAKKDVERSEVTVLAGASVHFDLSFLRVHMPMLAANLSHRVYDVSAVKLFCRSLGMTKLPPEEAHRALPDVSESVRHAQLCADWIGGCR